MIGIMQGRLLPLSKQDNPGEERRRALSAGIDWIEHLWPEQPTCDLTKSACLDFLLTWRVHELTNKINYLAERYITDCARAFETRKCKHIVVPLVDDGKVDFDMMQPLAEMLQRVGGDIAIHIESDWPPAILKTLMRIINRSNVKICYDTGNVHALGYDAEKYIDELAPWIASVHVKDRNQNGSRPLGTGGTPFDVIFKALGAIRFQGPYILQTPHAAPGEEIGQAISDAAFVMARLL